MDGVVWRFGTENEVEDAGGDAEEDDEDEEEADEPAEAAAEAASASFAAVVVGVATGILRRRDAVDLVLGDLDDVGSGRRGWFLRGRWSGL